MAVLNDLPDSLNQQAMKTRQQAIERTQSYRGKPGVSMKGTGFKETGPSEAYKGGFKKQYFETLDPMEPTLPGVQVQSSAIPNQIEQQPSAIPNQIEQQPSAIPGVQVQQDAPMLPNKPRADYVTDAQIQSSGGFQDAQNVHQSRLADITRMQQENAARQGTGAQTFTMDQAPQLPGRQESNNERPGSAEWFYRQAELRQQSKDTNVNRGLDMEQQRIDQTGNLAQQRLQQDQTAASGKAGQQQFENQLATDKFGFEQKKAGQEQANKSMQFDAKLENQLGTIISDPKFRQMSKAIEGASTPEQRAQLMANFQKVTGVPYDTVNNYLQKKTNPNSTGLPAALLQQ